MLVLCLTHQVRAEDTEKAELRVLTLNAWQFPLVASRGYLNSLAKDGLLAKDIRVRRKLIAHKVAESEADIVTFQELWGESPEALAQLMNDVGYSYCVHKADVPRFYSYGVPVTLGLGGWSVYRGFRPKHKLKDCASTFRRVVHYSRRFGVNVPGGIVTAGVGSAVLETADHIQKTTGNGLMICSKYPLKEAEAMHFSYWRFTGPEEPLAPKGALKATVNLPALGNVDVVTTHLDARAYDEKNKEYVPRHTRVTEAEISQLYKWIQKRRSRSMPGDSGLLILTGDLNLNYREIENAAWTYTPTKGYLKLTDQSPSGLKFIDTFREVHGFSDPPAFTMSRDNLYEAEKLSEATQPGEVIDYVFYSDHEGLKAIDSKVMFKEPITEVDRKRYSLDALPKQVSDHFGVMTIFKIKKKADRLR